jgi:SAM-dependent methyltransferase
MAGRQLRVGIEVMEVHPAPDEHGGRCNEVVADLLHGPGMQVRMEPEHATDFLVNGALTRPDDDSDTLFYSIPRMVQHLDARCLIEVQRLYRRLLAGRSRVLDLMASWDSHLPDELPFARVEGLGMNQNELEANGRLNAFQVHDLNRRPTLPYDDASFDAVVCSVSVEYLTDPLTIFREVNRVLAPGGLFVVTFSNRWFPGKAINLWVDLHEFERLGLVSEYFLQAGGFEDLHTLSQRGLPRPLDDPHYGKSPYADPLYAVWATKAG